MQDREWTIYPPELNVLPRERGSQVITGREETVFIRGKRTHGATGGRVYVNTGRRTSPTPKIKRPVGRPRLHPLPPPAEVFPVTRRYVAPGLGFEELS